MEKLVFYCGQRFRFDINEDETITLFSVESEIPYKIVVPLNQIQYGYSTMLWFLIKGCSVHFVRFAQYPLRNVVRLAVCPGVDVDILDAVCREPGVFELDVALETVERIWLERVPIKEFDFPPFVESRTEVEAAQLMNESFKFY